MARLKLTISNLICPDSWVSMDNWVPYTSLNYVQGYVEYWKEVYGAIEGIDITINSGGGSYTEGMAIHDYLKALNVPITTIALGECGSIATVIFGAGDTRLIGEHAEFFIHYPEGGVSGNIDDISAYLDDMVQATEKLIAFYVALTGLAEDDISEMLAKQTTLSAAQTVEMGFATGLFTEVTASRYSFAKTALVARRNKPATTKKTTDPIMAKVEEYAKNALKFITALASGKKITNLTVQVGERSLQIGTVDDTTIAEGMTVTENGEPVSGTFDIPENTSTGQPAVTIVVVDGVITEVNEPSTESETEDSTSADADKTNMADVLARLTAMENSLKEKDTEITAMKTRERQYQAVLNRVAGESVSKDVIINANGNQKAPENRTKKAVESDAGKEKLEARKLRGLKAAGFKVPDEE